MCDTIFAAGTISGIGQNGLDWEAIVKRYSSLGVLLVAVAALSLLAGCFGTGASLGGARGSGRTETRNMDLGNFTAIDASYAFSVDVQQGEAFAVAVTADDNLWNYVDVRVTGQTLHLGLKQPGGYTNTHLSAKITMPALNGVTLSGASRATLAGFTKPANDLRVNLSGASNAGGQIQAGTATFDLSGASRATLSGAANSTKVSASGASNVDLGDFPVDKAEVGLSGASRATLNVKSNLDYELSGASNLTYSGSPSIGKSETSGSSKATKR